MRLLSIASGSSGNCIYVGNDDTHILIDTGISGKRIEAGLNLHIPLHREPDSVPNGKRVSGRTERDYA